MTRTQANVAFTVQKFIWETTQWVENKIYSMFRGKRMVAAQGWVKIILFELFIFIGAGRWIRNEFMPKDF